MMNCIKNIIIWGTGVRCAMWQRWLRERYAIVCFTDSNQEKRECLDGVELLPCVMITQKNFDAVVIVADDLYIGEIKIRAGQFGIDGAKVFSLDEFIKIEGRTGEYEKQIMSHQISTLKSILESTDNEIHDDKWMYKKVIEYGIFCFQKEWRKLDPDINWTYLGLQQIPEEFSRYCVMLSKLRIANAIEIGVYRGRSAYFVCAVLSRMNPELKYIMVDIEDRLDHFEEFHKLLPALAKCIPASSEMFKGRCFDYVFIDADHSYDACIGDYSNTGKYSSVITAFHDIYAHEYDVENGGTVRAWREVKEANKDNCVLEFSKYPDKWMGIGCILTGGSNKHLC